MVDGIIPVQRQSSLCWEVAGTTFDEQLAELKSLGADVRAVDACTFRTLEPHVAEVPDRAMLFPNEAVASSGDLADALLTTNQARGARHVTGVSVTGLLVTNGRVTGVYTDAGDIAADQVLVAAGTGTAELMKATGINIPMLRRPGAVVKTRPVPAILKHVLASPRQEVRQLPCGALLAPASASHQSDNSESLTTSTTDLADQTILRLREMFPDMALEWERVMVADRPMPQDGLPVVGHCGPKGLYVATMHSGITLAALMGELVAEEMISGISNRTNAHLAPYRPQRFKP